MRLEKLAQFHAKTPPNRSSPQPLFVLDAPTLAESLSSLSGLPSVNFVTLLIADFESLDGQELGGWTAELVRLGCRYFCAWGKGCEMAHEVFDEECSIFDPEVESVIMTTDHGNETLEEAIWFALNVAVPASPYDQNWNGILGISINDPDSTGKLRSAFADPVTFSDRQTKQ